MKFKTKEQQAAVMSKYGKRKGSSSSRTTDSYDGYEGRVQKYEKKGLTRSDAQGVVDVEMQKEGRIKKGDKVSVSDGQYVTSGTIHSVKPKARNPYVIKRKDGSLIGAKSKDVSKQKRQKKPSEELKEWERKKNKGKTKMKCFPCKGTGSKNGYACSGCRGDGYFYI